MKFVYPHIKRIEEYLKNSYFRFATYLLIIFMAFNISISTLAAFRQDERRNNISPSDAFDNFLDTYYSDEVMDRVYENKKEIVWVSLNEFMKDKISDGRNKRSKFVSFLNFRFVCFLWIFKVDDPVLIRIGSLNFKYSFDF